MTAIAVPELAVAKVPVPLKATTSRPTIPTKVPVMVAVVVLSYTLLSAVAVTVSAFGVTVNVWFTTGALSYVPSHDCEEVIVVVPNPTMVNTFPKTVATLVSELI